MAAFCFALFLAMTSSFATAGVSLVLTVGLVLLARLSLMSVSGRLVAVNGFILFMWLFVPATYGGEPWLSLGPIDISRQGVLVCALITIKSNAVVLLFIALVNTMSMPTLGSVLSWWGAPSKLVQLLLFTYRYVHVIGREFRRLLTAAKIRGFSPRTNLRTYRTYAFLAAMVLVRSLDRAERVEQAMRLRGFTGQFHGLAEFRFQAADLAFCCLGGLSLLCLAWLEWMA